MSKALVIACVVLAAAAAGAIWFVHEQPPPPAGNTPSAPEQAAGRQSSPPTERSAPDQPAAQAPVEKQQAEKKPKPVPKGFCERDFDAVNAREADVAKLQAEGGLVHIFEREARLADAYGCAAFYLDHGLDVNAVDPRPDHDHLTGLHFAIKRNDPKMLRFMIDHGADLKKRAGKNDVKPMGYAYYLALNDTRIDRNEVIGILDAALTRQAAAGNNPPTQ